MSRDRNRTGKTIMNINIEVIQDNAGGITVQNTETKAVAYFQDTAAAKFDLNPYSQVTT